MRSIFAPALPSRTDALNDWSQASLLAVESCRLRRWYRPGLLLIGDAAHTMLPVGGVGISVAIQDAAVASNVLGPFAAHSGVLFRSGLVKFASKKEMTTTDNKIIRQFLAGRAKGPIGMDEMASDDDEDESDTDESFEIMTV